MFIDDTITAISTPAGHGGIGIVRMSGNKAISIADSIFRSPKNKRIRNVPSHRIIYGYIIDPSNNEVVDEVLVSIMKAPNTYTREDVIEINCHGGPVPLRRILEITLKNGARLAEPGEFTRRAFLNGRIDLAQAEAVLDTINAMTVESQRSAINQLKGSLSERLNSVRDALIELTAIVEAHIDFPEEDIEPLTVEDLRKRAIKIADGLKSLTRSTRYGRILREGVKVAIVGRPNVGKSSLLNQLIEQDKAIVTEMPGTTRDIVEDYLNIKGIPVHIMDTAGIRDVNNVAEKEGVTRSIGLMDNADIILLVLDGSKQMNKQDRELIKRAASRKRIIVINKMDLEQKLKFKSDMGNMVRISAKYGTGIHELKKEIINVILKGNVYTGQDMITNVRHVHAIDRTMTSIKSFTSGLKKNVSPELLAVDLRDALDTLGEILGLTTPDEILNRIFSSFCIGK